MVATYVAAKSKDVSLLIADRTFSNVPALAQRMIAGWAGPVVKWVMQWETDNCGNFLAAPCAKLLCSDPGDEIIVDGASLKSGVALRLELDDQGFDLLPQRRNDGSPSSIGFASSTSKLTSRLPTQLWCKGAVRRVSEADSRPKLGEPLTEAAIARFSDSVLSIGRRAMQYTAQRDQRADSETTETVSSSTDEHVALSVHAERRTSSTVSSANDEASDSESHHMLARDQADDSTGPVVTTFPEELLAVVWMQLARLDGYCGHCLLQAAESGGYDRVRAWTASLLRWGGYLSAAKRRQLSLEPFDRQGIWIVPLLIEDVHSTLTQLAEQHPGIKFDFDMGFLLHMMDYLLDSLRRRWRELDEKAEQRRQQLKEAEPPKKTNLLGKRQAAVAATQDASEDDLPLIIHTTDPRLGSLLPLQCGHNKNYLEPEKEALVRFLRHAGFLS